MNERTGTVYATDLTNNQLIEVARKSATPRLIPTGAVDIIDLDKGVVTKSVPTGAGTLSVAADHRSGKVVAVNRTAATATVVDPRKGAVVTTVATGANPNHVEITHGTAYVADKSGTGPSGEDQVTRFRVR